MCHEPCMVMCLLRHSQCQHLFACGQVAKQQNTTLLTQTASAVVAASLFIGLLCLRWSNTIPLSHQCGVHKRLGGARGRDHRNQQCHARLWPGRHTARPCCTAGKVRVLCACVQCQAHLHTVSTPHVAACWLVGRPRGAAALCARRVH